MDKQKRRFSLSAPKSDASLLDAQRISIQLNRRANLRACIEELERAGMTSESEQAEWLGLRSGRALKSLISGDHIFDGAAREIEWAMQKRKGWLNEDHRQERLEQ